jgi:hypothetical protein
VEGATGDVGMAEPPSARAPVTAGDGSLAVGVGAALVWVGVLAARLSIEVPIVPWPLVDGDVPPVDAEAGTECAVGDERPDTEGPPPEWDGPDVLGVPDAPPESAAPCDVPPGDGSSKSDSVGPECEGVGLEVPEPDPEPESDPESDPESEPGPAPTSGVPMSLPLVSADIPPPMFAPTSLPERVDVEESDPDESEPLELESELESESEPDEDESDDEREDESDDDSESPSPSPPPAPSPPSDVPPCPSIRLSIAWWARCPAFSPSPSRTPSARVCGVCLMASQPALAPCLTVVARS